MVVVVLIGVALLVASFIPFIWPRQDRPTRADAVVVLAGDHGERVALGLRLVRAGVAPTLVLAGQPDNEEARSLCRANPPVEVVCLRPPDDNTRNEARATAELAASRGWRHLVVATSTAHVTRARLLFRRCVKGNVSVVGANPPYGLRTGLRVIAHEWLGTAYALTTRRGC